MKPLLVDIAANCPTFKTWYDSTFDWKSIPHEAIDEIASYSGKTSGKTRIALADLLRLLVLKES